MHIKKVIIEGFGSYAKAENPELFGPGINVIRISHINHSKLVGVNGSGKSNFFRGKRAPFSQTLAIQFVLSPKYMKIDEEQMRGLFHVPNLDFVYFVERASRCRK